MGKSGSPRRRRSIGLVAVVAIAFLSLVAVARPASAAPTWTAQLLENNPNLGSQASISELYVTGVSCPDAADCVAVGYYLPSGTNGTPMPLAATLSNGTWTTQPLPVPSGATGDTELSGISCQSMTSCVAIGEAYFNYPGTTQANPPTTYGFSETLSGTTWMASGSFALPTALAPYSNTTMQQIQLTGISCLSATSCVAVGWGSTPNTNAQGYYVGLAYTLNGTSTSAGNWSSYSGIAPSSDTPSHSAYEFLNGVSCASVTSCEAVGSLETTSGSDPVIANLSGTTWSATDQGVPSFATSSNGGAVLAGVSCPGTVPSSCTAVGSYNNQGGAYADNLGTSTLTDLGGDGAYLKSVSCPATGACAAVGSSNSGGSLIETLSGSNWSPTSGFDPAGATGIQPYGISCSGDTSSCHAVGSAHDSSNNQVPLVETDTTATSPPPTASEFAVSVPSTATAGAPFNVQLTAESSSGMTVLSYSGSQTITFTGPSDSPSSTGPTYPTTVNFSHGSGTAFITLTDAEITTLTATQGSITGTSTDIDVGAANTSAFTVAAPPTATAGNATRPVDVTALDAYGNRTSGYSGTVHFTSTDPQAALPGDTTLASGSGTFSVTYKTAGDQTVTATDTTNSAITGTSSTTAVNPASATTFAITGLPATTTAGTRLTATVTATDAYGNTTTGYSGIVHFTSSDPRAILPADAALTNGAGTFNVTYKTAGNQTITATDTTNSAITGTSGATAVNPAAASRFVLTVPSNATAGSPADFNVDAVDAYGNTATGYSGIVHFTSSDPQASLPNDTHLSNGVGTDFPVTYKTAGNETITATDTANGAITGTSYPTMVSPASATTFTVSGPATATAGTAINVTVTAKDPYGNVATGYTGTVHFTSSDPQASLPADTALTNGAGTFNVTYKTAGNQTITATDTTTPSITGTSPTTTVNPAAAATFTLTGVPTSTTAGTALTTTVIAKDPYGNTATGYTGTVHLTSTDPNARLAADHTLTNGTGTFSVTFTTAGSQTVTATDTTNHTVTGTSNPATAVSPAGASSLFVSAPMTATAGAPVTVTVTALDAYGNVATSDNDMVHLTSTDPNATLGSDQALSGGSGSFQVTFTSAGSQTVTATDTSNHGITGTSNPTTVVGPGATTSFTVTVPSNVTAGSPFTATITARDGYGNTASAYSGTQTVTLSGPASSPNGTTPTYPATVTFSNGVGSASITVADAQTTTLTATQGNTAGTSGRFTVSPATATGFTVSIPAASTVGTSNTAIVTATDAYGNTATGYSGTVHLTSTDPAATLGSDRPLSNGTGTFSVTFNTVGNQTVSATDTSSSGVTGTSNPTTVTAPPGAPTGLVAKPGSGGITLTWQAPTATGGLPLTQYQVFRGTSAGGEAPTPIATVSNPSYVDGSAQPGTAYWYTVKAINAVGPSPASNEASAEIIASLGGGMGVASTPDGGGYWLASPSGSVASFGDATSHGSAAGLPLHQPIVGMAPTPDGGGYWLVAADGGIFAYGDAVFYGSTGNIRLAQPIVGMAVTPDGHGYWLVAADGGIFAYGDAVFYGSTGNIRLNKPVVGMAVTPDGHGYWLVASDGGIFAFGDAPFEGSTGNLHLVRPIISMVATPDGHGYWLLASDGGVFALGDAHFFGSLSGRPQAAPVVGMIIDRNGQGYELINAAGQATHFGS